MENAVRDRNEQFLRDAYARMAWHERTIKWTAERHKSFYRGDSTAEVPATATRLENLLDPCRNGADSLLMIMGSALGGFPRGEYPFGFLERMFGRTIDLVENTLSSCSRSRSLHDSGSKLCEFYNYLSTRGTLTMQEEHIANIERFVRELQDCFKSNARAFYDRTTVLLERRENAAEVPRKAGGVSSRGAYSKLTQAEVARDFEVSRKQVLQWEHRQTEDGPGNTGNPWGYYKALRLNPLLRPAYNQLVQCVRLYRQSAADAKAHGRRAVTFVAFSELYFKHQTSQINRGGK